MFYVVGDSHANLFTEYPEYWWIPVFGPYQNIGERSEGYLSVNKRFTTFRIGPCTAYNLCEDSSSTESKRRLNMAIGLIPVGSKIMFAFGEIDCRLHIWRYLDPNSPSIPDAVEKCVDRYLGVIREIANRGYTCYTWNVVPPIGEENIQNKIACTLAFNRLLSYHKDIPLVSIYHLVSNKDGSGNTSYIDEHGHLNQLALPLAVNELIKIGVI